MLKELNIYNFDNQDFIRTCTIISQNMESFNHINSGFSRPLPICYTDDSFNQLSLIVEQDLYDYQKHVKFVTSFIQNQNLLI